MSVALTPEQEQRLQHLAAQTSLSPDELAQRGVDRFLDQEEELLLAVKRGDEDIAAGRTVEHEVVVARIENLLHGR
ncbi:Predicted transcriptional regulator [Bryocella elongata]|uniref:Predicted transcriptional regulator n=1 Tax=Bryocella elongata TaxID=863522 RepID=A0A1H5X0T9_9BACT|nr:Predicted transcriptional regulator [Bryocella elongata]